MQIGGPASRHRSSSPPAITVALVDRDRLSRSAIRTRLGAEDDIEIVGEARNAIEGIDLIRRRTPNIVLIAFEPADRGRGETIGEILMVSPGTIVIVLSHQAEEESQLRALRAGAAGWLVKPIDVEALPRILRGVQAGQAAVTRALGTALVKRVLGGGGHPHGFRPVRSTLTQREWEVADLMVESGTPIEIATRLQVSPATVRTHIKHILGKLGTASREEAIRRLERLRQIPGA